MQNCKDSCLRMAEGCLLPCRRQNKGQGTMLHVYSHVCVSSWVCRINLHLQVPRRTNTHTWGSGSICLDMGEPNDRGREAKGKASPPIPLTTLSGIDVPYGDGLSNLISVWHAINKTSRHCAVRINKCNLAQRLEHSKQGRTCTRTAHP